MISFQLVLLLLALPLLSSKRLCFQSNQAGERGTEVAMYDYADFAEKMFNHESFIIFPNFTHHPTPMTTLPKFQKRFNTTVYRPPSEDIVNLVSALRCDLYYIIKAGIRAVSEPSFHALRRMPCPSAIHAVFYWEPHGSAYAAISPEIARYRGNGPVIPHIVRPPDMERFRARSGLRRALKIDDKTLVICRHGGRDSFDLDFAHDAVFELVKRHNASRLEFLFVNTDPFPLLANGSVVSHPQIRFLPAILDDEGKEEFIRTCDAMVHGRAMGETFGLAIAEFSVHNLPVITHPGKSQFHIKTLGERGFFYRNGPQLIDIVEGFLAHGIPQRDYNAYRAFAPDVVMQAFKQYFLDPFFNVSQPNSTQ